MLIPESYFLPIVIAIAILSFLGFYFLLKNKLKKNIVAYGGFAFAFLVYFILESVGGKVYLIDEALNVSRHIAIGTFEVPMKGGAVDISGSVRFNRAAIVNQSKKTLIIDEIIYSSNSSSSSSDNFQEIQAMSIEEVFLKRGYIDFFFDTEIPEEIEIRGSLGGAETKYWLHEFEE